MLKALTSVKALNASEFASPGDADSFVFEWIRSRTETIYCECVEDEGEAWEALGLTSEDEGE